MIGLLAATGSSSQQVQRPNILMICVDDLNDNIGALGHPDAITPNIDRLAARGALFANAHCQAPLCGPSRASIMTGLRPSSTGIYGMIADDSIRTVNNLTKYTPFLQEYFRQNGYYTMGVGKIFNWHAPRDYFDESGGQSTYGPFPEKKFAWDRKGTDTDWGPFPANDEQMPDDTTVRWAVQRLQKKYDQPFFLTVGFIRPHVPWYAPKKWFDLYHPEKLHLPPYLNTDRDDLPAIAREIDSLPQMPTTEWAIANNQWRNMLQAYLACVSYTDHNVGRLLDALQNSGYADNTIVVLWSDHGYRLGEKNLFAKQCLWDRATRAPLIIAGPGITPQVIADPVELLSIYPTLTDLAELPHVKANEGHSLQPFFTKKKLSWQYPAITTWGRNNHAVKTKQYRLIRYENGAEELYDIQKDPDEWTNLAGKPQYKKVIRQLAKFLPAKNELWASASQYKGTPYFINQKANQSK